MRETDVARRTIEQKIAHLDEQKRQLQARLSKQERARDTRRKILLGALLLQRLTASANEGDVAWLKNWTSRELPDFLTRDTDRVLLAYLFATGQASTLVAGAGPNAAQRKSERVLEPA